MNIGCDIESVQTFREHWKKKKTTFFERIFSTQEIDYCTRFKDPSPHFAARFCAKEAVVKAANPKYRLLITDIEVIKDGHGAPGIQHWKKPGRRTDKFFKENKIMVSLSHTKDVGMACVLIIKKNG